MNDDDYDRFEAIADRLETGGMSTSAAAALIRALLVDLGRPSDRMQWFGAYADGDEVSL